MIAPVPANPRAAETEMARHLAGTRTVVAAVELKQLGDLGEREPGGLRLLDVAQTAQVLLIVVSSGGGVSSRNGEEPLALVEPHCLYADSAGPRQVGNAHHFCC